MNTISSLLTDIVVSGTLLMVLAYILGRLLKNTSAATRHFYWVAVIIGLLLLPLISSLSPKVSFGFFSSPHEPPHSERLHEANQASSFIVEGSQSNTDQAIPLTPIGHSELPPNPYTNPTTSAPNAVWIQEGLVAAWFIGSAFFCLWICAGWIRLSRLVRQSTEASDAQILSDAQSMAQSLQTSRPFRIMISNRTMMPLVVGIRRAVLILPSSFSAWEPAKQRAVLSHEIGHIKRHDCLTHLLGQILCACYWFHPLAWGITRKLQSEAEAACDDLAIRAGSEPSQYAEHLLTIAKSLKGLPVLSGTAAPMAGHSKLEKRLRLILASGAARNQLTRTCILLCSGAVVMAALVVSSIRLSANQEETPEPGQTNQPAIEGSEARPQNPLLLAQTIPPTSAEENILTHDSTTLPNGSPPQAANPIQLRGMVSSSRVIEIRSNLEKPTEILWQAPLGKKVKKGELIVEFQREGLRESVEEKQIEIAKDQANIEAAKATLSELFERRNDSLKTQELSVKLAELNKKKGTADFKLRLKKAESDVSLAKGRLVEAEKKLASDKLREQTGKVGSDTVRASALLVEESKAKLEQAIDITHNLVNNVQAYETTEHELNLQEAKSKLQNARTDSQNKIAAAEAALRALEVVYEIKSKGLRRLEDALAKSQIYAPISGEIGPTGKLRGIRTINASQLPKGTLVRKNQAVTSILDPKSLMITCQTRELEAKQLRPGQAVTISVDALPNHPIQGKITNVQFESVAPPYNGKALHMYLVTASMENAPSSLRPGLTAMIKSNAASERQ